MRLNVLASGSSGNGYILYNESEALVLECGVPYSKCLSALSFDRKRIVGAFVTHEHGDHSKYVEQYLGAAIPVYMSKGTCDGTKIGDGAIIPPTIIKSKDCIDCGGFKVLAFDTQHDSNEPLGFLVYHKEMGSLLFATDTYYVKYKFGHLNQIMIECNYDGGIIDANVKNGIIPVCVRDRVLRSHMSLNTAIKTLKANDIKEVNNVVLLHLSRNNSDPEAFKTAVENAVGKLTTIASAGVDISFNKEI